MILNFKINTDIKIERIEDLYKLKYIIKNSNLKINKASLAKYNIIYDLDLFSLSIEFQTHHNTTGYFLYSENTKKSSYHMITFNLRKNGVKDQLFEFTGIL